MLAWWILKHVVHINATLHLRINSALVWLPMICSSQKCSSSGEILYLIYKLQLAWSLYCSVRMREREGVLSYYNSWKNCYFVSFYFSFTRHLWNVDVYYRVHNSPLAVPVLSQMNAVHILQIYCPKSSLILAYSFRWSSDYRACHWTQVSQV
jgi:hypothetical protein